MTNKSLYTWVAVGGIALASAGAWWFQKGAAAPSATDSKTADGAPAARPAGGGGAGGGNGGGQGGGPVSVEVAKVKAMPLQDDAQAVGTRCARASL